MLVGAVGVLALQALLIGGLLSMDSLDPILLNPDKELSENGISMVMLCGEGQTPGVGVVECWRRWPPTGM